MNDTIEKEKSNTENTAKTIYILYLVGIVIGITSIVGVIMAYVNKSDAPNWLKTHYQLQIRTFWMGSVYSIIGFLFCTTNRGWTVGVPILLFWLVWLIIRCTKGMKSLEQKEEHPNPTGWLF